MARQSLEHCSTKGSHPSTHQCMMNTDTVMSGMARCEGVEKKAKFSLFQRCSTTSCWGPGLEGWLLLWHKSVEGPKGWAQSSDSKGLEEHL